MAITKTHLMDKPDIVKEYLETLTPEYFDSVELTNGSWPVVCRDAEGNALFAYGWGYNGVNNGYHSEIYVSETGKISSGSNPRNSSTWAYQCANGVLIVGSDPKDAIMITKNNHGKTVFAAGVSNSEIAAGTWGDVEPLNKVSFQAVTGNQTQMVSFLTNCAFGEDSYTPNAFYMPSAQNRADGILTINGVDYITNGYWAIRVE